MKSDQVLAKCKLFKMFQEDVRQEISSNTEQICYGSNTFIYTSNDPASYLMILKKGKIEILTTKRTQFVPVHVVKPVEAFSISSVITGQSIFTAKTVEDSEIYRIPVNKLIKIIKKDFKTGYYFMKHIALLESNRLVKMHSQLDVTGSGYI